MNRPAVIMGLAPTGLAALRSLARMGVPCLGIWWGRQHDIGRHSRYLRRAVQVSFPPSHEQLLDALDELTEPWKGSSPVLIPASDVHATFIDEMQDELRARYTFRCSPRRLHAAFADKIATNKLCSDAGVRTPRTAVVTTAQTLDSVCADFRFPVIVKPAAYADKIVFPGKNFVAADAAALTRFFDERPYFVGRTVIQEVIRGGDGNVVVVCAYSDRHGRLVARAAYRKIRQWMPDYGITSMARSESVPEAASISEEFLNRLGYQGFSGIEFAEDVESGRYLLLEVNPRLMLPIQLILDANVDLIGTAYREMTESDSTHTELPGQRDGVYWWYADFDVRSFIHSWRRGRISLFAWLLSITRASSHATFDWRDPRPWLASMSELRRTLVELVRKWMTARLRAR